MAGRFPASDGQSQLRFADSGPHSPPRRRTRGRRCDLSLPCKKRAISGICLAGQLRLTMGISTAKFSLAGPSLRFRPLGHTASRVLAEPFNNNKKSGWGQRFLPHPDENSPLYSIDCSFQAPFSKAKSAWRLVLSLLPGLWAMFTTGAGTPSRFTPSVNWTPLAVATPGSVSS